jgi:16S rRNA U516 pseudouridylate synthase RsuA-like enzyme
VRIRTTGKNAWLEITVREGRNRQVRRMCSEVDHPVMKLKRIQYGPIRLGNLKPGFYRDLTPTEMERLQKLGTQVVRPENILTLAPTPLIEWMCHLKRRTGG